MTQLSIKNMVCPRCIMVVEGILADCGLTKEEVVLGRATIREDMTDEQRTMLEQRLSSVGFTLLGDPREELVEQMRTAVLEWVDIEGEHPRLSDWMQEQFVRDFSTLSRLFSEVRGMTLERYAILQRTERVKEMLLHSTLSASEIAYRLGYSSPAHLSTQFKQVTGISPKAFKAAGNSERKSLDEI